MSIFPRNIPSREITINRLCQEKENQLAVNTNSETVEQSSAKDVSKPQKLAAIQHKVSSVESNQRLQIDELLAAFRDNHVQTEVALLHAASSGKLFPLEFRKYVRAFHSPVTFRNNQRGNSVPSQLIDICAHGSSYCSQGPNVKALEILQDMDIGQATMFPCRQSIWKFDNKESFPVGLKPLSDIFTLLDGPEEYDELQKLNDSNDQSNPDSINQRQSNSLSSVASEFQKDPFDVIVTTDPFRTKRVLPRTPLGEVRKLATTEASTPIARTSLGIDIDETCESNDERNLSNDSTSSMSTVKCTDLELLEVSNVLRRVTLQLSSSSTYNPTTPGVTAHPHGLVEDEAVTNVHASASLPPEWSNQIDELQAEIERLREVLHEKEGDAHFALQEREELSLKMEEVERTNREAAEEIARANAQTQQYLNQIKDVELEAEIQVAKVVLEKLALQRELADAKIRGREERLKRLEAETNAEVAAAERTQTQTFGAAVFDYTSSQIKAGRYYDDNDEFRASEVFERKQAACDQLQEDADDIKSELDDGGILVNDQLHSSERNLTNDITAMQENLKQHDDWNRLHLQRLSCVSPSNIPPFKESNQPFVPPLKYPFVKPRAIAPLVYMHAVAPLVSTRRSSAITADKPGCALSVFRPKIRATTKSFATSDPSLPSPLPTIDAQELSPVSTLLLSSTAVEAVGGLSVQADKTTVVGAPQSQFAYSDSAAPARNCHSVPLCDSTVEQAVAGQEPFEQEPYGCASDFADGSNNWIEASDNHFNDHMEDNDNGDYIPGADTSAAYAATTVGLGLAAAPTVEGTGFVGESEGSHTPGKSRTHSAVELFPDIDRSYLPRGKYLSSSSSAAPPGPRLRFIPIDVPTLRTRPMGWIDGLGWEGDEHQGEGSGEEYDEGGKGKGKGKSTGRKSTRRVVELRSAYTRASTAAKVSAPAKAAVDTATIAEGEAETGHYPATEMGGEVVASASVPPKVKPRKRKAEDSLTETVDVVKDNTESSEETLDGMIVDTCESSVTEVDDEAQRTVQVQKKRPSGKRAAVTAPAVVMTATVPFRSSSRGQKAIKADSDGLRDVEDSPVDHVSCRAVLDIEVTGEKKGERDDNRTRGGRKMRDKSGITPPVFESSHVTLSTTPSMSPTSSMSPSISAKHSAEETNKEVGMRASKKLSKTSSKKGKTLTVAVAGVVRGVTQSEDEKRASSDSDPIATSLTSNTTTVTTATEKVVRLNAERQQQLALQAQSVQSAAKRSAVALFCAHIKPILQQQAESGGKRFTDAQLVKESMNSWKALPTIERAVWVQRAADDDNMQNKLTGSSSITIPLSLPSATASSASATASSVPSAPFAPFAPVPASSYVIGPDVVLESPVQDHTERVSEDNSHPPQQHTAAPQPAPARAADKKKGTKNKVSSSSSSSKNVKVGVANDSDESANKLDQGDVHPVDPSTSGSLGVDHTTSPDHIEESVEPAVRLPSKKDSKRVKAGAGKSIVQTATARGGTTSNSRSVVGVEAVLAELEESLFTATGNAVSSEVVGGVASAAQSSSRAAVEDDHGEVASKISNVKLGKKKRKAGKGSEGFASSSSSLVAPVSRFGVNNGSSGVDTDCTGDSSYLPPSCSIDNAVVAATASSSALVDDRKTSGAEVADSIFGSLLSSLSPVTATRRSSTDSIDLPTNINLDGALAVMNPPTKRPQKGRNSSILSISSSKAVPVTMTARGTSSIIESDERNPLATVIDEANRTNRKRGPGSGDTVADSVTVVEIGHVVGESDKENRPLKRKTGTIPGLEDKEETGNKLKVYGSGASAGKFRGLDSFKPQQQQAKSTKSLLNTSVSTIASIMSNSNAAVKFVVPKLKRSSLV